MAALSAVITTFDSERTIERCLASVSFCEEVLVLDSGSTDATRELAMRMGARVLVQPFAGYSAQKQAAIDHATHDWIVLLDSDEWLDANAAPIVRAAAADRACVGYRVRRREWMFWRWQHPLSRHNRYVRLFDRRRARMSGHAVHETVRVDGPVGDIDVLVFHAGDPDIRTKVDKANRYGTLQLSDGARRPPRALRPRMVVYPWFAFFRYFVLRGHWREGWAGYIAARVHAFYAFTKYAKAYEARRSREPEDGQGMPSAARPSGVPGA